LHSVFEGSKTRNPTKIGGKGVKKDVLEGKQYSEITLKTKKEIWRGSSVG
jgi:hypothetical protein